MKLPYRLRQLAGFVYRDSRLMRREWSWVVVFTFYALVNSASIALIGVAAGDEKLTLTLLVGVLMWSFLSVLFSEIAMSIAWERWDGTLEFTFMAPVPRVIHLFGVSLFAFLYSTFRLGIVLAGLTLFVHVNVTPESLIGLLLVLFTSSFAFAGLGLMAATLPVLSPSRGAEATNIFQGVLLLISGIYYPVSVLPGWLQPLAALSPATYALRASRILLGVEGNDPSIQRVLPDFLMLLLMGAILVPTGLIIFGRVEHWAKQAGKLKRTG
jgi:ABC-2 type transport system permease protein